MKIPSLEDGTLDRLKCPYRCLTTCNIAEARYCIAQALANA